MASKKKYVSPKEFTNEVSDEVMSLITEANNANAVASSQPPMAKQAPQQETMSKEDIQSLEMARLTMQVALKEAEKALAENKAADLSYKYFILQLYMKYGLTAADALDEKGNIHRGVNQ